MKFAVTFISFLASASALSLRELLLPDRAIYLTLVTTIPAFKNFCTTKVLASCPQKVQLATQIDNLSPNDMRSERMHWSPFLEAIGMSAPNLEKLFDELGVQENGEVTRERLSEKLAYDVPLRSVAVADTDKSGALSFDELQDYVVVSLGLNYLFNGINGGNFALDFPEIEEWMFWSCSTAEVPKETRNMLHSQARDEDLC